MVEIPFKIGGQSSFHLLDLVSYYVLAEEKRSGRERPDIEEVQMIFQLTYTACDFDTQLIDYRYMTMFYKKYISTTQKNALSIQDIKTLKKYKGVIREKSAGSKSKTIKDLNKREDQYKEMLKDQHYLFTNCLKFIYDVLEKFNNDFRNIDKDSEQIFENIKKHLSKGQTGKKHRKNRKEKFKKRDKNLVMRAIKRDKECILVDAYSRFDFESKLKNLGEVVEEWNQKMIRDFEGNNSEKNYVKIEGELGPACLFLLKSFILEPKVRDYVIKYKFNWNYYDIQLNYKETYSKIHGIFDKNTAENTLWRQGHVGRGMGSVDIDFLALEESMSGRERKNYKREISDEFLGEFVDSYDRDMSCKGKSSLIVAKKYFTKCTKWIAEREGKYKDYLGVRKKIQGGLSEAFKKRQRVRSQQKKEKSKLLAEKKREKKRKIRERRQKNIAKMVKSQEIVKAFNAEYKDLKLLMSDFTERVEKLNRGDFSFDMNTDPYYDFFDEFLYQTVVSCLKKYRGKLNGHKYKSEKALLTKLRVFKADMKEWKKLEIELKELYEKPFAAGKKETHQTFRDRLLKIVETNNFAKELFNWTCRLRPNNTYYYKGFTWGATYYEAMADEYLSPSTHYLKCRDIIYSIKEYLQHHDEEISDIVKLVLYKEAKMCEMARDCFYGRRPVDADGMDYWWDQNPYTISFN